MSSTGCLGECGSYIMTNRYLPSEEYKRKLRERHILEGFCLADAAVMLVLSVIFFFDINRDLWVPETVAVLGGILNLALSVRTLLIRMWLLAGGFWACGCGWVILRGYLNWR